jgi:hypothetical protein
MISDTPIPKPINDPDAKAIRRQYGKLAPVYARTRSEVADSLGDHRDAMEWREAQADIEANEAASDEQ